MIVYSEKILQYSREIKFTLKKILVEEAGLKVRGDRFYDETGKYSYPIKIVIFNNSNKLGYFDMDFYELGFHESAFYSSKDTLTNLIRHELAHYLTFIKYGDGVCPHGEEFRSVCKNLNWGKEIYAAATSLDEAPLLKSSSISRKIQKLISLGTSSNDHESTQAILKSRELLLKHNINSTSEKGEQVFLKRIKKQKRKNAKMEATGHILETFFVSTIYNYSKGYVYLEISGNAVNIEIAEYIADILDYELERLWDKSSLKGQASKNSFFHGIAKGYCRKIESLKSEYKKETTSALIIIENKLNLTRSLIYPRLSKAKSSRKHCNKSSALGEKLGKKLEFKQGLKNLKKVIKRITFYS